MAWVNPLPARLHKPAFALFLFLAGADLGRRWLGFVWPAAWEFLGPAVWFLASVTLAVGLARRLPLQNVTTVVALSAALGFAVEALNAWTDLPFGHRRFTRAVGLDVLGVAWHQSFLWVALTLSGRGVARLILRPWRKLRYYGFWVMAVATALSLALAMAGEAVGTHSAWWWRENRAGVWTWYGAPVVSVCGWLITALLIYGFTTPWFLNKQPVKQPTDWHPLVVWEVLLLWLTAANAFQGAWFAVGVGSAAGVTAALLAYRGGTW